MYKIYIKFISVGGAQSQISQVQGALPPRPPLATGLEQQICHIASIDDFGIIIKRDNS